MKVRVTLLLNSCTTTTDGIPFASAVVGKSTKVDVDVTVAVPAGCTSSPDAGGADTVAGLRGTRVVIVVNIVDTIVENWLVVFAGCTTLMFVAVFSTAAVPFETLDRRGLARAPLSPREVKMERRIKNMKRSGKSWRDEETRDRVILSLSYLVMKSVLMIWSKRK